MVSRTQILWAIPFCSWVNWLTHEFIFSISLQILFLLTYCPQISKFFLHNYINTIFSGGVCRSLVAQEYFLLCCQEYILLVHSMHSLNYLIFIDFDWWNHLLVFIRNEYMNAMSAIACLIWNGKVNICCLKYFKFLHLCFEMFSELKFSCILHPVFLFSTHKHRHVWVTSSLNSKSLRNNYSNDDCASQKL